ncbi:hypothetical protein [Motiliproteus sp. SC1-56]|uniref:hypothetical protein n=1 Tax=Motiliproteus sp. SC1-56 TaxID=2799565 RepID=UPI001A90B45B|nr:hypothetical protein [Motiliproteus sp. SC1-56]
MYLYRLICFLIIGIYLLSPGLIEDWGDTQAAWYRPFLPWLLLIGLAAWLEHRRRNDEL